MVDKLETILDDAKIVEFKPIPHDVEKDKSYFWCSCGKSKNQPFCDGSHAGSEFTPLKYVA